MATSALLSVCLVLALASPSALGAQCPAFAGPQASCGANSCGRFVFKGKFEVGPSKAFRVKEARRGLRLGPKAAPGDCCRKCRETSSCVFWNFFAANGACYLYSHALCPSSASAPGAKALYVPNVEGSYVGGRCHDASVAVASAAKEAGLAPVTFPLLPDRTFCLLSDPELHINMKLGGYMDKRAAAIAGGSAKARVWIREIGFVWSTAQGQRHTLRVVARRTADQERGAGFLSSVEVDGTPVPTMMLGDEVNLFDGQASILFDSYEKSGPVDVDRYSLKLEGLLEADIYVRPAHPLLQHKEDAMVHLNLDIAEVHHSTLVHGVLGQTYAAKAESEESNLDYNVLSQLISGSAAATTPFKLEGHAEDYWSSSILTPDCKFAQFGKEEKKSGVEAVAAAAQAAAGESSADDEQAALVKEAEEAAKALRQEDEVAIEIALKGKPAEAAAAVKSS